MMKKNVHSKLNIPFLSLASFIIVCAGIVASSAILKPILLALFVSVISAQPLAWLEKRKIPHGLAVTIVMLGALLIFFGLIQLMVTSIYQFSVDAPKYSERLSGLTTSVIEHLRDLGLISNTAEIGSMFDASKIFGYIAGIASNFGDFMSNLFLIVFVLVFTLLELNGFAVKTLAIVDDPVKSLQYLRKIGHNIRHYLVIKTFVSLLTGLFIWVSLTVIGVDYAILWAIIAFLLNFIPNIGSIIAGLPPVLFALIQLGWVGAVWTMAAYIATNMIIGNIIEPKVMGKGMGLSTLVVFLSLVFWGFLLGTVGMFLSVPLTMTVKIILEQHESTKWIAVMLGTQQEAQVVIERKKYDLAMIDNTAKTIDEYDNATRE